MWNFSVVNLGLRPRLLQGAPLGLNPWKQPLHRFAENVDGEGVHDFGFALG